MPLVRLRRAGLAAGLATGLAASLLLAACSTEEDQPDTASDETSEQSLLPPAEGETSYPLTLKTPYGETVLDERPERVAVIGGLGDFEATLALGVAPVVAPAEPDEDPWLEPYADVLADVPVVDPWADSFAVETVAAAEPDLIIALGYSRLSDDYDKLKTIAPVLGNEDKGVDIPDWRTTTELIGSTLDLAGAAEDAVATTDDHLAQVAEEHPEWQGKTVAIVINRGPEYGIELVNNDGSDAEELLSTLGFAPHPNAAKMMDKDGYTEISLENLSIVDADGVFLYQHGGDGDAEDAAAWLDKSPLFGRLGAVESGNIAIISSDDEGAGSLPWALSWPNALNLRWTADQLDESFDGLFTD